MFKNLNFFVLCFALIITITVSGMDFFTYEIGKDIYSCHFVNILNTERFMHDNIGGFKCEFNNMEYEGTVKCNVWEGKGSKIKVATSAGKSYIRTSFLLTRTVLFMLLIDILIFIKWIIEYKFGISLSEMGERM